MQNRTKTPEDALDVLIDHLGDQTMAPQAPAAAVALGQITRHDPQARAHITRVLVGRLGETDKVEMRRGAAWALGQIAQDSPETATGALLDRLRGDADVFVRQAAARALGQIKQTDAAARERVGHALMDSLDDPNTEFPDVPQAAARALGQIARDNSDMRSAITDALITLLPGGVAKSGAGAAMALGQIKQDDSEASKKVTTALVNQLGRPDGDPAKRTTAAVAAALGTVKQYDPERRAAVVEALTAVIDSSAEDEQDVVINAMRSFGQILPDDARIPESVTRVLIGRLRDSNVFIRRAAAGTLGRVRQDAPDVRDDIVNALVTCFRDSSSVTEAAEGALLFQSGPISAHAVLTMLRMKTVSAASEAPVWRAEAIAFSGGPRKPSDAWAYVTFLGSLGSLKPEDPVWPDPAEKATVTVALLQAIYSGWSIIQGAVSAAQGEPKAVQQLEASNPVLAQEAANAVVELVNHACPDVAATDEGTLLETAWRFVRSEATATVATFGRWFNARPTSKVDGRCWTADQRAMLVKLHKEMASMPAIRPQSEALARHLRAEYALPALGLLTTSALTWSVFWLGLIVAFPFNARVRSIYLYNDKVHGLLSVGIVPLLLTVMPFLRRLLLHPFRDRLLADARLTDFEPGDWYPKVNVLDSKGKQFVITGALPTVRGNSLLIGESGLGKTTFLRVLARQAGRTLVFLNARSCEKGVLEAIRRKASEVQGDGFFKSLIEARDLAVIIDALNEVNADIRAGIIAFVNEFPKADILVATQPIESIGTDRSPFDAARALYLRPLAEEDVAQFLLSRPVRQSPERRVTGTAYDEAVRRFIRDLVTGAPSDEARGTARMVLSNPANLTYAADLLSRGEMPVANDLIGQAFVLACAAYREVRLREFPQKAFAAKVVELRRNDLNYLAADDLPEEQQVLLEYRLLVTRLMRGKDSHDLLAAFFRHDTVMDYFMYIAFADNDSFQTELIDDPRFRGVYLLFAEKATLARARTLRDLLVTRAAETGDHALSDEYVRRLNARYPKQASADGSIIAGSN